MAKIRIGLGSEFNLKDQKLGLGENNPQERLDVAGVAKGKDLKVTGISSLTAYEGFLRANQQIAENTTLSFDQGPVSSLSGEIIVGTGQTVTVTENLKEDRFGPELITNGQFLSNVDDWTAFNSSNSFNGGRLRITRSGGDGRATYQLITNLIPGATYFASAIVDSIGSRGDFRIVNGNSWTSNYYLSISGTSGQVKTLSGSFTATGTTALVGFAIDDDSTLIEVDQVTVRRVNDVEEPGTNVAGGSEIECLKVYNTFTPPSGGTNERPYAPKPGQLYYNYDFKTIEFHDGYGWRQVDNTTRSGRGFVMGGFTPVGPATFTNIEFYNIMTRGNSQSFGNLTESRHNTDSCASETRAINTGTGVYNNTIDYITMASQSDGIDFGDLSTANRAYLGALASSTRGVFGGGFQHPSPSSSVDVIDYIEIATIGNALDFGNLSAAKNSVGAVSSPTRGVFSGGSSPGIIEYITIASKGNATTDALPYDSGTTTGASNSVKALFETDKGIFSLNISSLGNQEYFGDLTITREDASCASSPTRICFAGGIGSPATFNTIDYVTITSAGNAIDFGDISYCGDDGMGYGGGCSDSHGGLGGF